jgi:hypothetical protein
MEEWRRATTFWPREVCHQRTLQAFPGYSLSAVKQKKYGRLEFQAFPRPWQGLGTWSVQELKLLDQLIEPIAEQSEEVCERCGAPWPTP